MPLVVFKHNQEIALSHWDIKKLGERIRPIVAEFCSTPEVALTEDDIDWEPELRHAGAIAPLFAIEIETYAYPARIESLTRERTLEFKQRITEVLHSFGLQQDGPWLWIKYVSPEGHHI